MLLIQGKELRGCRAMFCLQKWSIATVLNYPKLCVLWHTVRKDFGKIHALTFHEYIRGCIINARPCQPYWPHSFVGVVDPQHSTIQMGLSGSQLFKHIFKEGCVMLTITCSWCFCSSGVSGCFDARNSESELSVTSAFTEQLSGRRKRH